MFFLHLETTINKEESLNTDIIKLYYANKDKEIKTEYYDYDNKHIKNIMINDHNLNGKLNFNDSGDVEKLKKLMEENQPIIIFNHLFIKQSLQNYGINLDKYKTIDLTNLTKNLEFFGKEFKYNINNIVEELDYITSSRLNRGNQLIELFDFYNLELNLSIDEMMALSFNDNIDTLDIKFGKNANENFSNIDAKTLLSIVALENNEIKTSSKTTPNELKFNIIRHLMEDRDEVSSYGISKINNKEELNSKIEDIFIHDKVYNINLLSNNKKEIIANYLVMYRIYNLNNIDRDLVKDRYNNKYNNNFNINEISI